MTSDLTRLLTEELARPVAPGALAMAERLAAQGGPSVAAVLFYGSALRTGDLEGVLDFYVLVDSLTAWHGRPLPALLNWLLPPNVEYWEMPWQDVTVRAKVAIMTRRQFIRAVQPGSLDTTIWARFTQPVRLVHARDGEAAGWVAGALARAASTAALWAVRLGPESGRARDFWNALFRHTYAAELRVEKGDRAGTIVDFSPGHYDALFRPALASAGITVDEAPSAMDGTLRPGLNGAARRAARRAWVRRRFVGKMLNILRLAKAAFTFRGGVDYIAWKIERHSGRPLNLTPWQRRHPILAAPVILWRLHHQGIIR